MKRTWLLAAFAATTFLGMTSCDRDDPAETDGKAQAAEVFARASAAMQREGSVFHAIIETESEFKGSPFSKAQVRKEKDEVWADLARDVAHHRVNIGEPGYTSQGVLAGGALLGPTRWGPAPTCNGANAAASLVLQCDETEVIFSTSVSDGKFRGRSTTIVAIRGERAPGDGTLSYTRRLHFDRTSGLPIGQETKGTWGPRDPVGFTIVLRFTSDFVSTGSLPEAWFEPPFRVESPIQTGIEIVVLPGGRFEHDDVTVPRGTTLGDRPVIYRLVNQDPGVAHNFALYGQGPAGAGPAAIRTGSCDGPCIRQTRVSSIDPGPGRNLAFRCDLHPDTMQGTATFEAGATSPTPTARP